MNCRLYKIDGQLPLVAAAELLSILTEILEDGDFERSGLRVQSVLAKRGDIVRVELKISIFLNIDALTQLLDGISDRISCDNFETAEFDISTVFSETDERDKPQNCELSYYQMCNKYVFKPAQTNELKKNNDPQTE